MKDEDVPKSLQTLERQKWRFCRNLYQKPIFFVETAPGVREFRLYFSVQAELYHAAPHYDDFLVLINTWKRREAAAILLPGLIVNGIGELEEESPARKVWVLQRNFNSVATIFLDDSPNQFNCGLGLADPARLRPFDGQWWTNYLSNRLQILKVRAKLSSLEARRYTIYKRISKGGKSL